MHRTPPRTPAAFRERKTHSTSERWASGERAGPNCGGKFGWTKRICMGTAPSAIGGTLCQGSSRPAWRLLKPATADPAGPVPRLVQAREHDAAAAPAGVDEAPAPDVDSVVMKIIEEDDVARLEPVPRDGHAVPVLPQRAVGKRHAHLRVDVHHQAGGVEARRARAAPHVSRAEMPLREGDDAQGP